MKSILLFLVIAISGNVMAKEVVATVNGVEITKAQFEDYHLKNLNYVQNSKITKERSLNDLINKIVGSQLAKKNKLQNDPKVQQKIDELLFHAQVSKDLEGKLSKIKVSDSEVKSYYANNPEYRTAQILFRLKVQPTTKEVEATINEATALWNQLKKQPNDFIKIATSVSQANGLTTSGDMGYQPATRLAPEYYAAIKGKKKGTITKPFRTQYGIHIVKVLGVKSYKQITPDMYKKIIYDQKRDEILKKYFQSLRSTADIKINKKYLK
jgi:peptidyl-prolyl cis-trans isomerase C